MLRAKKERPNARKSKSQVQAIHQPNHHSAKNYVIITPKRTLYRTRPAGLNRSIPSIPPYLYMAPILSTATALAAFVSSPAGIQRHASIRSLKPFNPIFNPIHHQHRSIPTSLYANPALLAPSVKIASVGLGPDALVVMLMSLIALQFGLQPILTRKFTPKTINRSTVVFAQDIIKFFMAAAALNITGGWSKAIIGWNVKTWLTVAGIPAVLYCIQNFATLIAYQNLSPLTFNVLNQTKTLSAALCCYLLMGKVQSPLQVVSLLILFTSACIIEKIVPIRFWKRKEVAVVVDIDSDSDSGEEENKAVAVAGKEGTEQLDNHTQGLFAVLLASLLSGLAGAFAQKNLQSSASNLGGRNSYLFSMELCVVSLIFMSVSMLKSEDGQRIRKEGFFHNWTPKTIIPILTNAAGGIIVGLVTKYAGSVRKGFALIFGLVLSGILQAVMEEGGEGSKISVEHVVGGCLAAFSLWMHSAFPAM